MQTWVKNTINSYKLSQMNTLSLHTKEIKVLDREKQSIIRLILTAIDGGTPAKSGSMTIIVNVLDINDNTPVFSQTLYKASVYENSKTEIDQGKQSDLFAIDQTTGTSNYKNYYSLVVDGPLDRESAFQYNISITATDEGSPLSQARALLMCTSQM
ncbi:hypothetical protein F7725_010104 [Dissostichus mawsoni]|uniref:Cadherin domain-containing protein n=1 Tax=Dissostichus mawsoni TaxID=36200 RepID=A0A7J5XMK8_DISMA|nr:hypothetical protein F7725_010104 [Dissostichus mawsoni]